MNIKQLFANATSIKAAITTARQEAKEDGRANCGKGGILFSRGAHIRTFDFAGEIINGEAESWVWEGTAKQFEELANLLRYDTKVAMITIEGGWNWAENTTSYNDGAYDPWVSEWEVIFGRKVGNDPELDPTPAPAEEAAPTAREIEIEAAAAAGHEAAQQGISRNGIPFAISEDRELRFAWETAWIMTPKPTQASLEEAMVRARMQARQQGWDEYQQGRSLIVNPYEPGSAMEAEWNDGWEQARAKQQQPMSHFYTVQTHLGTELCFANHKGNNQFIKVLAR